MARTAVLCVLLALLAFHAYAACDSQSIDLSAVVVDGSLHVDASALSSSLQGAILFTSPAGSAVGSVLVEFFDGDSYTVSQADGTITITEGSTNPPGPGPSAAGQILLRVPAVIALIAVALFAQRGSVSTFAMVGALAAVAVVAYAATCTVSGTLNVTIYVDQEILETATLDVPAADDGSLGIDASISAGHPSWSLTDSCSGDTCTITFTNALFGCSSTCGGGSNVASATCNAGDCVIVCNSGFSDCDSDAANGCEASITSNTRCGDCDTDCTATGGVCAASGSSYQCGLSCPTGFADCDATVAGCESELATDVNNCGACGVDCTALDNVGTNVTCAAGVCQLAGNCAAGFDDCDGDASNGCEAAVNTDDRCGSCTATCDLSDIPTANVVSGHCNTDDFTCVFDECVAGYADCTAALGCETLVESSFDHCGACGNSCGGDGVDTGLSKCVNSTCEIVCSTGLDNCDGDASNGCESQVAADVNNCGACLNDCTALVNTKSDATTCVNNICVAECLDNYSACSGIIAVGGCPISLSDDVNNCGTCGTVCAPENVVTASCNAGSCDYDSCLAGFEDCNGDRTDGCEVEVASALSDCGTCGNNCAGAQVAASTCTAGVCAITTCAANFEDCDADTTTGCETSLLDVATCGGCTGRDCAVLLPNAAEVECSTTQKCTVVTCKDNFSQCGAAGDDVDCTINLDTDPKNCGTCGNDCTQLPGVAAGVTCTAGVCDVSANCDATHVDCDGVATNGCEADNTLCSSPSGGVCTTALSYGSAVDCSAITAHLTAASYCNPTDGTCVLACEATWSDCDSDPTTGCEAQPAFCGSEQTPGVCETAKADPSGELVSCLALKELPLSAGIDQTKPIGCNAAGQCDYTCAAGFVDCDGSASNGCEIDQTVCPSILTQADCAAGFTLDEQCGVNCVDCTSISGVPANSSTCEVVNGTATCVFTCSDLCGDDDGDWNNGCEIAKSYVALGLGDVDCSKDVDMTNVAAIGSLRCNGDTGLCDFICKDGFSDCDGNPLNGCETVLGGNCLNCVSASDVSCGINKCVDCTALPGTLGVQYQNPRHASASASTCLPDAVADLRLQQFACDTSPHYLHPRFDPPNGVNGACQAELCRDLDGNWENGCESAQLYGRGKKYDYGVSNNLDVFGVEYSPDPYQIRFDAYEDEFLSGDSIRQAEYKADIPILSAGFGALSIGDVILNYDSDSDGSSAIISKYYDNPEDCILSEWSDWGLCTWEDDCLDQPHSTGGTYWLRSRIRTREIVRQASGGGYCHLPIVEDFYRFAINYDDYHSDGLPARVDYSNGAALPFNASKVKLYSTLNDDPSNPNPKNLPRWLGPTAWTWDESVDVNFVPTNQPRFKNTGYPDGMIVTCAPMNSCPDFGAGVDVRACNITAWSEWSACTAKCDGDWAGGVRIRTREVISGSYGGGGCFKDEFTANGVARHAWSGRLYEEDWQCNDFSCSSFDCNQLADPEFAELNHIYLGLDGIEPHCDGADWPEYVLGKRFCDDDAAGDFELRNLLDNFGYEYRWPGHCLYECEEGYYDCNHDPSDGCETDTDFCTVDSDRGSLSVLEHPMTPWDHPHGECTLAWKYLITASTDCNTVDFENTVNRCDSNTGLCDTTCSDDDDYYICGDSCVNAIDDGSCGEGCVDCTKNQYFGTDEGGECVTTGTGVHHCSAPICSDGCADLDGDASNGCEVADYAGYPYPNVEALETEFSGWSDWTNCTYVQECGRDDDIFRHVPIQSRFNIPVTNAYNGGYYPPFEHVETSGYYVYTDFVQTRECDADLVAPCIECTNQLESHEVHCVLSEWTTWSACTADCSSDDHEPFQIRTRDVVSGASNGGRCPPPGDTWGIEDIRAIDGFDTEFAADASYLFDARPCNTHDCTYPEDCDALNYYYPGHFNGFARCRESREFTLGGAVTKDHICESTLLGCNLKNGYCDDPTNPNEFRDGCETFVYPTQCGDIGAAQYAFTAANYDAKWVGDESAEAVEAVSALCGANFRDCTTLPGVTTPYAAACLTDVETVTLGINTFELEHHYCDTLWACDAALCADKNAGAANVATGGDWLDGCEEAQKYTYPFISVVSADLATTNYDTATPFGGDVYKYEPTFTKFNPLYTVELIQNDDVNLRDSKDYFVSNDATYKFDCREFMTNPLFCDLTTCNVKDNFNPNFWNDEELPFTCYGSETTFTYPSGQEFTLTGTCGMNCEDGFEDCDLDPRNGCETGTAGDVHASHGYVWAGQCDSSCDILSHTSCGADLCIDCTALPGVQSSSGNPECALVEEVAGERPHLNENDFFAIQYACGYSAVPKYAGLVDFDDKFCEGKCKDFDKDWRNGCEAGTGYSSSQDYGIANDYNSVYGTKVGSTCDVNFLNDDACDERISGFRNPVPGAWFYGTTTFTGRVSTEDLTVLQAFLDDYEADIELTGTYDADANVPNLLANRAFDCSLIYSTARYFVEVEENVYEYDTGYYQGDSADQLDASDHYTFAEVFHVDASQYTAGVCDPVKGLCQYVCEEGWADYDLDPSNGCEADLSGPCGKVVLAPGTPARTYIYKTSSTCGYDCQDCRYLPGSYQFPASTSDCGLVNRLGDIRATHLQEAGHMFACNAEVFATGKADAADAYKSIICDPRSCIDRNLEYTDGCETAVGYKPEWALYNKYAHYHKYDTDQFWGRDDIDAIVLDSDDDFPTDEVDDLDVSVWVKLFNIGTNNEATTKWAYPSEASDEHLGLKYDVSDYVFHLTGPLYDSFGFKVDSGSDADINNLKKFEFESDYTGGLTWQEFIDDYPNHLTEPKYNEAPSTLRGKFTGIVGSFYDCSNSEIPSDGITVDVSGKEYTIHPTTDVNGPWFHVKQGGTTSCYAGWNPGAPYAQYSDKNLGGGKVPLCRAPFNTNDPQYALECFLDFQQVEGAGKCKLDCEDGWQDCDGDPSNGCESSKTVDVPYVGSRCDVCNPLGGTVTKNYNHNFYCGAGACLGCTSLSGVASSGSSTTCVDGGSDWKVNDDYLADNTKPAPINQILYPSDYYCTNIINNKACLKNTISYLCDPSANPECAAVGKNVSPQLPVCMDRDGIWQNGCEVALGYNVKMHTQYTAATETKFGDYTLKGSYDREIGVLPYYDYKFNVIDYAGLGTDLRGGFDCSILNELPTAHTHLLLNVAANLGCNNEGKCRMPCAAGWTDADKNPWNGCESWDSLCTAASSATTPSTTNIPKAYTDKATIEKCDAVGSEGTSRVAFCDGGRVPYPDWADIWFDANEDSIFEEDSAYYGAFEIMDHGLRHVNAFSTYAPEYSRYTIKGYWDNVDIDVSCRVWSNQAPRTTPVGVNAATGYCALECASGYSDCDGNPLTGCEHHTVTDKCLGSDGSCLDCTRLPGIAVFASSTCLSGAPVSTYTLAWEQDFGTPSGHSVLYEDISTDAPQCDTRKTVCDPTRCRDYDGDWENGCEFPMSYTVAQRAQWEVPGVVYDSNGDVSTAGFDCSWITDPQPDAGGRNYGGKSFAEKHHILLSSSKPGYCKGTAGARAGKCDFDCVPGWRDCDEDPTNGCETDLSLCAECVLATGYPAAPGQTGAPVNCSTLVDFSRGFVPGTKPICLGREGQSGQCSGYFCNVFNGKCDSGYSNDLNSVGCVSTNTDDHCGADYNWRAARENGKVTFVDVGDFDISTTDFATLDSTGRCATCRDLSGYESDDAFCQYDPSVAGHSTDKFKYNKPLLHVDVSTEYGDVAFDSVGNTVGDYLCQLHGELGVDDDGACDRNLCVDEDYFWANGCETAVNYAMDDCDQPFSYHFAYNNGAHQDWPVVQTPNRGVWCPFLQIWSLSSDNYATGGCRVFPCPHFAESTVDTWITCDNNATSETAGKCTFECNTDKGYLDCDQDPLTGCEVNSWSDGTCGSGCEKIACNDLPGLNPFYWNECIEGVGECELNCDENFCVDANNDWTDGCETAVNYDGVDEKYNCETIGDNAELHIRYVKSCNGEPGHLFHGKCEFECAPGWFDCDGEFSNGCEHDGNLCQDCNKALRYVSHFDVNTNTGGAQGWEDSDYYRDIVYDWETIVDERGVNHYSFAGPEPAYGYNKDLSYVAVFDCDTLSSTYPGHFDESVEIKCDADATSSTAGLCTYACNNANGYWDCDGDPRNGCEHESLHESCGQAGQCRNCFEISGVNYELEYDVGGVQYSAVKDAGATNDIYEIISYYGTGAKTDTTALGCIKDASTWNCNLQTCNFAVCADTVPTTWENGCELAKLYDFARDGTADEEFDCSLLGPNSPDFKPRDTNDHTLPSYHVVQVQGTYGCDLLGNKDSATGADHVAGHCYYQCEDGFEDCDGDPRNGCEIDLSYCVNNNADWGWGTDEATDGCESALGYTASDFVIPPVGPIKFDCVGSLLGRTDVDSSKPIYCDGGQFGDSDTLGLCVFTCADGYQDCDGDPSNGCEYKNTPGSSTSCNCQSCSFLPGMPSGSSTCEFNDADGEYQCTLACNDAFCSDADNDWRNGCETAHGYDGIDSFDCAIWEKNPLEAKRHHVDLDFGQGNYLWNCYSEDESFPGQCNFFCKAGYSDCDGDPANGCEETNKWCTSGRSGFNEANAALTASDRCSNAQKYYCSGGVNSLGTACIDPSTGFEYSGTAPKTDPVDCFDTFIFDGEPTFDSDNDRIPTLHIDNSTVLPYCDRNPANLETRGDCVFVCEEGYANCNSLAGDGCEADVSQTRTCTTECVDCAAINGINTALPYACVEDTTTVLGYKCTFTCLQGLSGAFDCDDVDGDWRNGCEVARNNDKDADAVFVNEGHDMNCHIMQLEAYRNPDLFKHHLHIDLRKPVTSVLGEDLPAGSIFCNGGVHPLDVSKKEAYGKCYFVCLDGFVNDDTQSYNGCEKPVNPTPELGGTIIGDPFLEEGLADAGPGCVYGYAGIQ